VTQTSQPQPAAATRAAAERIAAERAAVDERVFAEATQANSVAACETYIRTNPRGASIAEAQRRIAALNEQARRATEERAATEQADGPPLLNELQRSARPQQEQRPSRCGRRHANRRRRCIRSLCP
jgi:hypothetical protein